MVHELLFPVKIREILADLPKIVKAIGLFGHLVIEKLVKK